MKEKEQYLEYLKNLEEKYGLCPKCGRKQEHLKETHVFCCCCGNYEWYPERFGDLK